VKAGDAGLIVVNLQIANSSWEEEKEAHEFHPNGTQDDEGDKDENNYEKCNDGVDAPAPVKVPPLGYFVPIYMHSDLDEETVVANLEPAFKLKSPEDYICRIQVKLTPSLSAQERPPAEDLITQAVALHPPSCSSNPYLHKTYILVIDTADPTENGMLIINFPPSDSALHSHPDLIHLGAKLSSPTPLPIRVPYSSHSGIQNAYLTLANGDAAWSSDAVRQQPVFLVFQYGTHGKELGFAHNLLDSGAAGRKFGEERFIYVPEVIKHPGHDLERISWDFDESVRRFPEICREKRWVEGLERRFFVIVDGDGVRERGVRLVRKEW